MVKKVVSDATLNDMDERFQRNRFYVPKQLVNDGQGLLIIIIPTRNFCELLLRESIQEIP